MKLSSYIQANGLSLTDFSVRVGLPVQTISRYVNGARCPHASAMRRIYEETGGAVTPNDFFDLPPIHPPPANDDGRAEGRVA